MSLVFRVVFEDLLTVEEVSCLLLGVDGGIGLWESIAIGEEGFVVGTVT